jgi:hypothetical protein
VADIDEDVLARLVVALERRDDREERLVRALEYLVQNEQRKLAANDNARARALAKTGPTTPAAVAQVRARLAKHRGTK